MSYSIESLTIYPIKSTAGLAVEQTTLRRDGLDADRKLVVLDPEGRFRQQRDLPRMALIQAKFLGEQLQLSAPGREAVIGPLPETTTANCEATVWRRNLPATLFTESFHQWLSAYLKVPCRLARLASPPSITTTNAAIPGFFDAAPILIIGTESLADLNRRLAEPIAMNRFRGNVIVETREPYEEDRWGTIQIGATRLRSMKPCGRCVMITVNPATGTIEDSEPLTVLAQYRKQGSNVYFGQYFRALSEGALRVGDSVAISDWAE